MIVCAAQALDKLLSAPGCLSEVIYIYIYIDDVVHEEFMRSGWHWCYDEKLCLTVHIRRYVYDFWVGLGGGEVGFNGGEWAWTGAREA